MAALLAVEEQQRLHHLLNESTKDAITNMLLTLLKALFPTFLAVFAVGVLIFIHEIGHFLIARKMKMKVEVFSIGLGQPLRSWIFRGVKWQLCSLPFGGYVKIADTDPPGKRKTKSLLRGFYSSSPWKRILVILAGPTANLLFAMLAFSLLWLSYGYQHRFAEHTQCIGWVDPHSHLYAQGVRPGDQMLSCAKKPYKSFQDLATAALLKNHLIPLQGCHYQEVSQPFSVQLDVQRETQGLNGLLNSTLLAPANQLLYTPSPGEKSSSPPPWSPMHGSGIRKGDRIVWLNGQRIFSFQHLFHTLNEPTVLCTVQREQRTFLAKIPRLQLRELQLTAECRGDIDDWRFEKNLTPNLAKLFFIPYQLTADCKVKAPLVASNPQAVGATLGTSELHCPLHAGDQILAVWGIAVDATNKLLELLQTPKALLIVQRTPESAPLNWKTADRAFRHSPPPAALNKLQAAIGIDPQQRHSGSLHLLAAIELKTHRQIQQAQAIHQQSGQQAERPLQTEPQSSPADPLQQEPLALGIALCDAKVRYNPSPEALFFEVASKITQTLTSLASYRRLENLAGPVGVIEIMHYSWKLGMREGIFWMGTVSINLALFNLLPIPLLDGGQICFALYEAVTRRPISAKMMERINLPFFLFFLAIMLFFTYQDLMRMLLR